MGEKKSKKEKKKQSKQQQEKEASPLEKRKRSDSDRDDGEDSKEKRKLRRLERQKWLDQVPKTDENGISYTKQQLRRMSKRMAKGLDPIESEQEKQERLRSEAELRRQEQDMFQGVEMTKSEQGNDDENDNGANNDGDNADDDNVDKNAGNDDADDVPPADTNEDVSDRGKKEALSTRYRSPRKKPVPTDYVCSACKNSIQPAHWIYDCPKKVTQKGANQVAKNLRGLHDPSNQKVFVSGLPFSITLTELKQIFGQTCGPVARAKLLTFPDSGRCKGQAYITFQKEDGARKALKEMNGKELSSQDDDVKDNKKSKNTSPKALKLRVTKVLNRKRTQTAS